MPNLATTLKHEITRLARKEVRALTTSTKQASARHRREIAELKRLVQDLSRRLVYLEGQEKNRVSKLTTQPKGTANGARFSPKWVRSHRERLDLSAADYAALVGVSALTIYNWEHGKTRPGEPQLASLVEVKKLGKREAWNRLELLER